MTAVRPQRHGGSIAMTTEERDAFLSEERVCRVATAGSDGRPHVAPLWFVWDALHEELWLYSIVRSLRWVQLEQNPHSSIVVDAGEGYWELRGVELSGRLDVVGPVPRVGGAEAALEIPERLFGAKYLAGTMRFDGRHAWLRLRPDIIVSWDFRKLERPQRERGSPSRAEPPL